MCITVYDTVKNCLKLHIGLHIPFCFVQNCGCFSQKNLYNTFSCTAQSKACPLSPFRSRLQAAWAQRNVAHVDTTQRAFRNMEQNSHIVEMGDYKWWKMRGDISMSYYSLVCKTRDQFEQWEWFLTSRSFTNLVPCPFFFLECMHS